MNIRKLLARLNAKAPRLEFGRGGIPEFTPQDIAAALGLVDNAIGREIFCMAWWPDGAALTRKDLREGLKNLLFEEYSLRFRTLSAAKLQMHLLESVATDEARKMKSKAVVELAEAKKRAWPNQLQRFGAIADAVVLEICAPKLCRICGGRGEMKIDARVIKCEPCGGLGLLGATNAWRANQVGVGETAYRQAWRSPYEWLYERATKHESDAAKQLSMLLGQFAEAA